MMANATLGLNESSNGTEFRAAVLANIWPPTRLTGDAAPGTDLAIAVARASIFPAGHRQANGPARGGLAPWQVRRVVSHIESRLASTIRVADLAAMVGLSTSHFARVFKVSTGQSVHLYIIERRMHRARELMLTTEESLCQIALACGLCDQAHFSRLFRNVVGMTPKAWRTQSRSDSHASGRSGPAMAPSAVTPVWRSGDFQQQNRAA